MLDIKIVRQDPERVKTAVKNRQGNLDKEIDQLLEIDVQRREIITAVEELKAKQNSVSKMIPQYKKEGKDVSAIFAEMKTLSEKIKEDDAKLSELDAKQRELLLMIPNVPSSTVPVGADDSCNPEIRRNGTPKEFDFELNGGLIFVTLISDLIFFKEKLNAKQWLGIIIGTVALSLMG